MKKTIMLTVTLIISYSSIGQNSKFRLYSPSAKNYLNGTELIESNKPIEFLFNEDSLSVKNFYWMAVMPKLGKKTKYYQIHIPEVLNVSGNRDTLEIQSNDIKYIKINGKVYEVKRIPELGEVIDNYGFKSKLPYTVW